MALIDVLNSLSLQPAAPTNVQPGIPLSIGIVPDVSQVRTTEIQMIPLDLEFIGKGVIFPNANPADPTTTGPLPIQNLLTVPPSITPGVQGLLGKIRGNLPVAIPTDVLPRLDVTWQITDTSGNDMVASGDAIPSNGLNDVVLTALFLPEFVELTAGLGAVGTSTRRVSASVTLTAGATVVGPRTIGPVDIIVPKLPIPTVLAMFVHKPYHGPTLIMVPADSAIPDLGGLAGQIQALQSALNPIRTIARLAALITGLDAITTLLNNEPHISFRKTDDISNLNDITLVQRSWYENDTEAEDELSSLFMIGPAGRAAEFFNDRGHDDGEGKFTFTVGPPLFAGIRDLHRDNPASEPLGTEIVVNHGPDGWWVDTFGDELSSVRFLALAPIT